MSISFLFLLLLFIDGFSLAQDPNKCNYDAHKAVSDYACFPTGDCKEAQPTADFYMSPFICDADYQPEKKASNEQRWMYNYVESGGTCISIILENQEIRCRKNRGCDLHKYFIESQCEGNDECVEPTLNEKTYVTCDKGALEMYLYDSWMPADDKIYCGYTVTYRFLFMSWPNRDTSVQLLRCRKEICKEKDVRDMTDGTCSMPDCEPIKINEFSIACSDSYNLEGRYSSSGIWRYFDSKSVDCYGSKITPEGVGKSDEYDKYRCMKQRSCKTTPLFDSSICEKQQSCKDVVFEIDYHCPGGYELQYIPVGPQNSTWEKANKLTCDFDLSRLIIVSAENIANIIPKHIRCMKDKLCDPDLFFDSSNCNDNIECKPPILIQSTGSDDWGVFICPDEFGLQADLDKGQWMDIKSALCNTQSFTIFYHDIKTYNEYPLAFRCVRMKIDEIDDNDCEMDEVCKKPFNCNPMKCADNFHLQTKIDEKWKEVESSDKEAKCDSNMFYFAHKSGKREEIDRNVKLRCAQKKCTQCANPCPTCVEAAFTFTVPTKWGNECSEFKCGPNTQTVVKHSEDEPRDFEKGTVFECNEKTDELIVNNYPVEVESIECQYLCTLESPITTLCYGNNETCRPITLIDTAAINECPNMYYEPDNKTARTEIHSLKCNRQNGSWVATQTNISTTIVVPKGNNVYCFSVKECDISRYFPTCEDEEEECGAYTEKNNKFHCDDSFVFWSRENYSTKWIKMDGVVELECRAGQILANEIPVSYEFQATCRPKSKASLVKGESKLGLYLGVTCMILILIVIIIATVILRVTGNGWLHTIIIEKARGNKKRGSMGSRNNSVSSVASGKTQSINSHNSTTSRKSTKRTQRKVTTKVARPSSSHSSFPGATGATVTSKNKPAVNKNEIIV